MAEADWSEEAINAVKVMREWISKQPHLPQNISDDLILRFAHSCYYDLDKAKVAAELFFTLRSDLISCLKDRDPLSPHMQKIQKILNIANLKISGKRNLWLYQINDPGLDNYDYILDVKLFFASTDSWLLESEELEEGNITVLDVKDISLKFLTKYNMSIARKLLKYQQEAFPIRLKQVHIVNTPPIIDKIFAIMKPFMKKELTEMIHFHTPDSETLFKYINKEDLPEDYGGLLPKMDDLNTKITALLLRHRESLNENLWVALDKKSKNKAEVTTEATFRSLTID